jgi:DoxX
MTVETRAPHVDSIRGAAYQAFWLLRVGFTVAPILFGIDKFFNWTVHWPDYLAAWINNVMPGSAQDFMYFVGAVEIAAGLVVAVAPMIGAPLVAAWLAGIVVNLLTNNPPEYYDIAVRDFGLMLAALTLTRLAWAFGRTAAEPAGERAAERRLRVRRAA